MGDHVQLQQVMMNLMNNGIDAMTVQQADEIFYAFFTTKRDGTGVGLSFSRSIVEAHNGRLWAADNMPRGACFHLALPTFARR
jgi:signal transduction histidine kinase